MKKLFLFLLIFLFQLPLQAEEYIERFHADIQVNADATLTVTETIVAIPEQKNIKHGIFRDLPTGNGAKYEIIAVQKNGYNEPTTRTSKGNMLRLRIGNANEVLQSGNPVTYVIQYKARNTGLGRFDTYDEVYWNATGVWQFPIRLASARVILPDGASFIQQASYRGRAGSKQSATYNGENLFSTHNLAAGEQLTIALGFTKGIIAAPNEHSQSANGLSDITNKMIGNVYNMKAKSSHNMLTTARDIQNAIIIFGGVLIYYVLMWLLFGRDTHYQTPMVEYEVPKDISPEQAYFWKNTLDTNSAVLMGIHLVHLVQSGFIQVSSENYQGKFHSVYFVVRTGKEPQTPEEKFFAQHMHRDFVLDGNYDAEFTRYVQKLSDKECRLFKKECNNNRGKILFGVFLFAVLLSFTPRISGITDLAIVFGLFISYITTVYNVTQKMFAGIGALFLGAMMVTQLAKGENIFGYHLFFQSIAYILVTVYLIPFFAKIMPRPTKSGAVKLAKISGIELFLKTLDIQMPSDFSRENAEELYPYALALGLSDEWLNRFGSMIGPDIIGQTIYNPQFYKGLRSTASYSSRKPSSGSRGGGRSGGGGGGGGGGGW